MKLTSFITITPIDIIFIVLSAIVVVGLLIFILSKFAFQGAKNKKILRSLSVKYSYVRSLLLGENIQYIKRIEAISDINLLMRPAYDDFFSRFEQLRNVDDRKASRSIQILNEALAAGNKEFKKSLIEHRTIILDYERKVTQLSKDLTAMIKPESEIREESVYDKEKLRIIKNMYRDNKDDLEIVVPSFEKIFNQIELLFKEYDTALNGAYYDEARTYLEKIRTFNDQLEKSLQILPLLVVKATVLIPEKINDLKKRYDEAAGFNVPLHHLRVSQEIETFNGQLSVIRRKLMRFETRDVEENLNKIANTIDRLIESFNLEIQKQKEFGELYDSTYLHVNELEQRYVRLVNRMPQFKEYYQINPIYERKLDEANVYINSMMGVKRSLDAFLHSATKQPYSLLVEKVHQLKDESAKVEELIREFQTYMENVRIIAEDGYAICEVLFIRFKELEVMLRRLNVPRYSEKFDNDFDNGYTMISGIRDIIRQQPIDINQVEVLTNSLRKLSTHLEQTINDDVKYAESAEQVIVSLNAYRTQFSELHAKLREEEQRFFSGLYKTTYENSIEQLKKYQNRKQ
ncbi:MAG: septation ring formation regulator EzrA [Bacilli bacterium]|nr:septation ring formation regulator EzrA [Bacilli bacterium]